MSKLMILGRAIDKKIHYAELKSLICVDNIITVNEDILFLDNNSFFMFLDDDNMILILPRLFFNKMLLEKNITDANVEEYKKTAFISICDSKSSCKDTKSHFEKDHSNVIRLFFEDIVEQIEDYKLFDNDQAKRLVNFIETNKDKQFIIHCEAGISRSGAVGQFINDIYKKMPVEDFQATNSYISPNQFVYYKLVKTYKRYVK